MILTADWHLRSSRPRCRLDNDWIETQMNALKQIEKYSKKYGCPIVVVGDVFDTAAADITFTLLFKIQQWAAQLEYPLYLLAGNHDLQYHDIANIEKSGVGILLGSDNIHHILKMGDIPGIGNISAFNFGEEKIHNKVFSDQEGCDIVFLHRLVFPDAKSMPPNVKANTAKELLDEFSDATYIFTGDYHKSFIYEKKGRFVINPGCILRQSANEKEYECGVYLIDTDKQEHMPLLIKDEEELVTDEYLREEEAREDRIESFVELLKSKGSVSLDFVKNVETRIKENKQLEGLVVDTVRELIYEGGGE